MQTSGSQTGTKSAMLRFSHAAVRLGKVPSTGIRLTGMSSPMPSIMRAVTCRTNSGALAGTNGGRSQVLFALAGTVTSCRRSRAASTALKFRCTTSAPLRR